MDSKSILYSKGKNDECYTPAYGVTPILQYIPKDAIVWCPFDTPESEFVKQISAMGNKVIYSHIDENLDFYKWEPDQPWDMIISNPPFTNKKEIFLRAMSFNKPFALIMNLAWLNDSAPKKIFHQAKKQLQLLMFDNRMKFNNPNGEPNNKITFSSAYFCWNFLPRDLICYGELKIPKRRRNNGKSKGC